MEARIMHLDVDAFFPSVEQADDPSLCKKALIIGGLNNRSVVASCSYEARLKGVHSGMPTMRARTLCPEGIFLPPRFDRYKEISTQLMHLLQGYTPQLHIFSIDEAFLDFRKTHLIHPDMKELAKKLQKEIYSHFSLTTSIGIARNNYCAKIASDYHKPNGITILKPGTEEEFLGRLPLEKLWGLGKHTYNVLTQAKIHTVESLRQADPLRLQRLVGKHSSNYLLTISKGEDPGIMRQRQNRPSISVERTYAQDLTNWEEIKAQLLRLAQQLSQRMIRTQVLGSRIRVKVRLYDFSTHTIQGKIPHTAISTQGIYRYAYSLIQSKWKTPDSIRLLGIGIADIVKKDLFQQEIFSSLESQQMAIDARIHALSRELGTAHPVIPARTLLTRNKRKKKNPQ